MKTKFAFEGAMRSSKFASLDAARKSVVSSPMLADYIIDHLCEIGVLSVLPDGSVAGVANDPKTRAGNKRPNISTDWKSTWPPEEALLAAVEQPIKFRDLQQSLAAEGHASGHWYCLHALWALEKRGLVRKDGKEYVAVSSGGAAGSVATPPVVDLDEDGSQDARLTYSDILDAAEDMLSDPKLVSYSKKRIWKLIVGRFASLKDVESPSDYVEEMVVELVHGKRARDLPLED